MARLFGYEVTVTKAPVQALSVQNAGPLVPISYGGGGTWLGRVLEPFTGAWQRNISADCPKDVTAFSAVYSCIDLIASDISKLPIQLVQLTRDNVWQEVRAPEGAAFRPVLTKPNSFQTRIQFLNQWMTSKLIHGNTYVLKERDDRSVVRSLYVLDPKLVRVYVTETGEVYYVLKRDPLTTVFGNEVAIPAGEIIHDRGPTLWHPLHGVSPIFACGVSAIQGLRMQQDSEQFFANAAMPAGQVIGPPGVEIPDPQLEKMKSEWANRYSGPQGRGQTAFFTYGMKFEPMRMNNVDAQLIDQLRWTVEDVARCFHMPLHMLSVPGSNPSYNNIGALTQAYYSQTLQGHIESIEALLNEGLGLVDVEGKTYGSRLDIKALVRMDPGARMDTNVKGAGAGILTIDEARADYDDLAPIKGGNQAYMQQQNWPLQQLADRDPAGLNPTPPAPPPPAANDETVPDEEDDETRERNARDFLMKELADVEYA